MAQRVSRREAGEAIIGVAVVATLSGAANGKVATPVSGARLVEIDARPEPITIVAGKAAMLVIDMQNDFGANGGMFERAGVDISGIQAVVPNVRAAISAARSVSMPIVYLKMAFKPDLSDAGPVTAPNLVKHAPLHPGKVVTAPDGSSSRILVRDTWNTEIIPELRPQPEDTVVYKSRFSGFYRTELDDVLRRRGIEALIVTGCTTSVCVESTVRDAMFRDYRCLILEDCTAEPIGATESRSNHQASLLTMQTLFGWISDSKKFSRAFATA
jgi:ureidoacrylate peracid hydrolase